MGKAKITVTIERTLIHSLDRLSKQRHQNRSQAVEEAVKSWQHSQTEHELIEGYRAMAKENMEMAKAGFHAAMETLK